MLSVSSQRTPQADQRAFLIILGTYGRFGIVQETIALLLRQLGQLVYPNLAGKHGPVRQNDFTPGLVNIGRKELVKLPVRLRNARHVCQNTRHTGQRPPARAALPQDTQKIPLVSKQTAARGRLPQIDAQDAAARKAVGPVGGIYLLKAIRQKRLHLQSVNSFALSIQIEEQVDRIAAERPVKTEVDSRRRLLRTLKRVQSKIFQPVRVGKYLAFTVVVRPHIMGRLRLVIGILQPDSPVQMEADGRRSC